MPCWYYEKKELRNTPSIQDGIDYKTECRYRKEGAFFIFNTARIMDLGCNTMATGVVYFHRFYMFHSFKNFPRYVTACCCLFLAGKVEETPKKFEDIIKTAKTLLLEREFKTFGENPKKEVLTLERILLKTIKFDLQVEHPHSYVLKYAKCLKVTKRGKDKLKEMVQMACAFVNDSLCDTTLSLQWEPEIIAIALMYLAGKLKKFEVVYWVGRQPKHLRWWEMFVEDVTMDILEDICHQMLDLFPQANNATPLDSPPTIPSSEMSRERAVTVTTVESASNTPNVTPGKPSKSVEASTVSANGCPATDIAETSIKPLDTSTIHFPTYSTTFVSNNITYSPAFPPTNVSVPPPPVNTMNHIVPTIHRIGSSTVIRPMPLSAPAINRTAFQPYSYPTTASYFSATNPIPPIAPARSYIHRNHNKKQYQLYQRHSSN